VSELGDKQRKFTLLLGRMIVYAYNMGYELTLGEGYDDDGIGHMKGSTHYVRLGQDLNLFLNGMWLDKGPEMEKGFNLLHDKWELMGGTKRIAGDLNHFSFEYLGKR
jgi:hypothetical protein